MLEAHPTADELSRYVTDALGPTRARAVEAHCAACGPCGAALRREACVEAALYELADRARESAPRSRPTSLLSLRAAGVGLVGLAVAAAALLTLNVSSASHRDGASRARVHASLTAPMNCSDGSPCGALASRSVDASWQPD